MIEQGGQKAKEEETPEETEKASEAEGESAIPKNIES